MTKKSKKVESELQEVELFGVTHKFSDLDYFTPNMRMQMAEILDRMNAQDISNSQAVQEIGLLLTHHPKSRRSVNYNRYNAMLQNQPEVFEEVVAAGSAVFKVITASLSAEVEDDPKAEAEKEEATDS